MVSEHQPLLHVTRGGVYQGVVPSPLVACSSSEVGPCSPSDLCVAVVGEFSTTSEVYESEG
jgi:hypothetical protein